MRVVRVALDVPLPTLFDYAVAPDGRLPQVGQRVAVPFGRGRKVGVVLEVDAAPSIPVERIKPISQVFDDEPALPPDVLELMRFGSDYYRHPLGQVVIGALPPVLRRPRAGAGARATRVAFTAAGRAHDWGALPARAVGKRRVVLALREAGELAMVELRALTPAAGRVVAELRRLGLVEPVDARAPERLADAAPDAQVSAPCPPTLTAAQQACAQAVHDALGRFAPFLLHGVTGSGKTEVYFDVIAAALARGQQALVLVPEINLTPQLVSRFTARFPGVPLSALHSDLAEGARLQAWRAAQSGRAQVVIGTRLAVFTPMPGLGLVIVDEEHDASFKQQEGFRYSARDLAVLRAKRRDIPVVLGSATPSLESFANARSKRFALLRLPSRAGAAMPSIQCIDTRKEHLSHGLSATLLEAMRDRLERREQSLVFVNRRGYSPALVCPACGWASSCTRCSARLVLHLKDRRLRCHYCGHEEAITVACPPCGNQELVPAGHGTQRIETALRELLPTARLLRVDRDSTRRRQAFAAMEAQIRGGEVDILVGTQMLAKGHDFPRLTLVGVINADSALYSSDFRASERLFALLTQVAGRAGRGREPGQVLIQSDFPEHPVYQSVRNQDYAEFAESALAERREAGFPPYSHQTLLRAEAARRPAVDDFLWRAARAGAALEFDVEIFDPVPPAVGRVAGRERGHLLVQAAARAELQRFLSVWHPRLAELASRSVRWTLDVDPLEV